MSTATRNEPYTHETAGATCANCGLPLAEDQEWCLECGVARTLIHRPPDWRIPVAIVGLVTVLVIGGFVLILNRLSNNSSSPTSGPAAAAASSNHATSARTTAARTSTSAGTAANTSASTNPSSSTPPATSVAQIPGWAPGLPGYTVVLASRHSEATADATAQQYILAGTQVGVLESSEHPDLIPGYWVVFYHRYPTRQEADTAAIELRAKGYGAAHVRLVERQGQ